jgi:hypothetical protein
MAPARDGVPGRGLGPAVKPGGDRKDGGRGPEAGVSAASREVTGEEPIRAGGER